MGEPLSITTKQGLVIKVEETLPYEPANYVTEEFVHLGYPVGQDAEYPLYCLSASGTVEVRHEEQGAWFYAGTWDSSQERDW